MSDSGCCQRYKAVGTHSRVVSCHLYFLHLPTSQRRDALQLRLRPLDFDVDGTNASRDAAFDQRSQHASDNVDVLGQFDKDNVLLSVGALDLRDDDSVRGLVVVVGAVFSVEEVDHGGRAGWIVDDGLDGSAEDE